MDNIYEMEIEAALAKNMSKDGDKDKKGSKVNRHMVHDEDCLSNSEQEQGTPFGGKGGNIMDMKFIRFKIKRMSIDDDDLCQQLIENGFSLTGALPLPDVYTKNIKDQFIKLSNYDVVSVNEFEFTSLTLYNFKVSEETITELSNSQIQVMLDDLNVHGQIPMTKLLLAKDFQLKITIPLKKTVILETKKKKLTAQEKKQELLDKIKNKNKDQQDSNREQKKVTHAGQIEIEINLQRGDTEEELERNYQIKLKHQEDVRKREEELQMMEKRKRAMMLLEEQPTFAQLYLHVDQIGKGGITIDREGNDIEVEQEGEGEAEKAEKEPGTKAEVLEKSKRNLYIAYKSFPTLEKLMSAVIWNESEPVFGFKSQFPVLMTPDVIDKLEKFTFVLEVWDEVTPERHDLVGLVKVPLASFCYSLKTTEDDIFSLNFLADQHNRYPMVIADENLPIYSPRYGRDVGNLKILLALGTPSQVNRQIQKEAELERTRLQATLAMEKSKMQATLLMDIQAATGGSQKITEEKMQTMIQENNQQRDEIEEEKVKTSQAKSPFAHLFGIRGGEFKSFEGKDNPANKFANALRQSLHLSPTQKDYDIRDNSFLSAMRKMFEEVRSTPDFNDFNGEDIFPNDVKQFDGSVLKDEFIYTLLNKEQFTMTRTEISNVTTLMLNISGKDKREVIDLDEIQYSYSQYLKYYEGIEARVIDLLEKFKLSISKKLDTQEQLDELVAALELKSSDSKLTVQDLKNELDDRQGIQIRDAMYDQLASYFDLDRSGQIYITSFLNYLHDSKIKNFNFFKLNPGILQQQITEYVRNCITTEPEQLQKFEAELKKDMYWKTKGDEEGQDADDDMVNQALSPKKAEKPKKKKKDAEPEPPEDILLHERINAKLFQFKMKRMGIALSLWEVFTLFEFVNMRLAKMTYEPQRYHYVMYEHFYKAMTALDFKNRLIQEKEEDMGKGKKGKKGKDKKEKKKGDEEDALSLAEDLNEKPQKDVNESGLFSEKEKADESADESSSSSSSSSESSSELSSCSDESELERRKQKKKEKKLAKKPFQQVKHVFSINVKELKNIPILAKFIKDAKDFESATLRGATTRVTENVEEDGEFSTGSSYIQNVAVKYSFPLDEDEILESDYIRHITGQEADKSGSLYDYSVSMNTVHTYLMPKEDQIQALLCPGTQPETTNSQSAQLFNISVALYQDNREFVIGNAQLPLEDLSDLVRDYNDKTGGYTRKEEKASLNRVLFLYGTSYSQRENCIIGKVAVEISYSALRQFLSKQEAKALKKEKKKSKGKTNPTGSCFMHRETYINRKIPLNALLTIHVDRVSNLKESIENIEHFARIHQNVLEEDARTFNEMNLQGVTKTRGRTAQQIDRRRILTQVLKNGLNLVILSSMFDEDEKLREKFPESKQTTRMLYNSLNPVFGESYQLPVQMDTKIFDYLKTKRAVFEVRHYIMPERQPMTKMYDNEQRMSEQDYITLGHVRVPLLHLITKNNGIDGDFVIMDEYKQQMGALKLRIALNHHNTQRPLFSGSTRLPNQVSVTKPQRFTADTSNQLRATTMIDKSVNLRNSFVKQGGDDFARAGTTFMPGFGLTTRQQSQYGASRQILALNFVELILHNRNNVIDDSFSLAGKSKAALLYLKFKFLGESYQTKFVSLQEDQFEERGGVSAIQSTYMRALNLMCFDISKTIFLPLDLNDQGMIEQAFSRPLEIQLWQKITAKEPYKQADSEDLLGSFFIELNELPRSLNMRVKGVVQSRFICSESYYTMYDAQKDGVSRDRLGLKLYLFENENEQSLQELDQVFHSKARAEIDRQIITEMDSVAKGYVELEDLQQLIEDKELDKRISNRVLAMINEFLEFKNSDCVFYSPLFGLPPPYFKQAKSFDTFDIVQQTMNELMSLDSHEQGFIPLALFRSVLEHELKIKVKIVDDFVDTCRQPLKSLDVNCTANSFQSQLDFIVLIRKLAKLVEIKDKSELANAATTMLDAHQESEKLVLSIDIESAMRIHNPTNHLEPPNAFVKFKSPDLQGCSVENEFQTNIVNSSCYPSWQSRNHSITIPLTQANIQEITTGQKMLEFDVFHAQFEVQQVQPSLTLIGTAYIDFSALVFDTNSPSNMISGYSHIINRAKVRSSQELAFMEPNQLSRQSQGQLKTTIRAELLKPIGQLNQSLNMSNQVDIQDGIRESLELSQITNPFKQQTFGTKVNPQLVSEVDTLRQSQKSLAYEAELAEKSREQLLETHQANMDELDEINKRLLATLNKREEEEAEDLEFEREEPSQEQKFKGINSSLSPIQELTELTTQQQMSFSNGLDKEMDEPEPINPALATTMKTDAQRATMTTEMRQLRPQGTAVFNPFKSKAEEEEGQSHASPRSEDNSINRD